MPNHSIDSAQSGASDWDVDDDEGLHVEGQGTGVKKKKRASLFSEESDCVKSENSRMKVTISEEVIVATEIGNKQVGLGPAFGASLSIGRHDKRPWKRFCQVMLHSTACKIVMVLSLGFALFGSGLWTLIDVPDEPGLLILDTLMTIIIALFVFEIVGLVLTERRYRWSFFFWMDVLGTLSMTFEISFMLGDIVGMNTVLLRAARTAKLGARVGRLFKLLKYMGHYMVGHSRHGDTSGKARLLS